MNLRAIANGVTQVINPNITGSVSISNGYTVNADGTEVPSYAVYQSIPMQVQAVSGPTLAHLDALNIQGVERVVYLNGVVQGLNRPLGQGGDLLTFAGQLWKVVTVLEPWDASGWVKVAVTLQNNS